MPTRTSAYIVAIVLLLTTGCESEEKVTERPSPPVISVVSGNQSNTIDWSMIGDATGYNLYWSNNAEFSDAQIISNVSPPYVHSALENGKTYYYFVTSFNSKNESFQSNSVSSKPVPPPGKPVLVAPVITENSIEIVWSTDEENVIYHVYSANEPGVSVENYLNLIGGSEINNVTSPFVRSNYLPGIAYYFIVVSENTSGISEVSNEVFAMLKPQAPFINESTPGDRSISINWNEVVGGVTNTLYVATESGITKNNLNNLAGWQKIENVSMPYRLDNLVNGVTYYYAVSAKNAATESELSPEESNSPANPNPIQAGGLHSCAIKSDLSLWCWGGNTEGQLGIGTSGPETAKSTPTRVGGENFWNYVATGNEHTCAINTTGLLTCWGLNMNGQLGSGDNIDIEEPVFDSEGKSNWRIVTAGNSHTCAIDDAGLLFCWGDNGDGQLGIGSNTEFNTPKPVKNSDIAWNQVAAGGRHTCAIKEDRSLWCWGRNTDGQLGDDTNVEKITPVRVEGVNWKLVATGEKHTCALKNDNSIYCWGGNDFGQLGKGDNGIGTGLSNPQRIGNDFDWISVAAGKGHSCGVKESGLLLCWGNNGVGQLGDSVTNDQDDLYEPIFALGANWKSVSALGDHTCGIKTDGSYWCWGLNEDGQLGFANFQQGQNDLAAEPVLVNTDTNWRQLGVGRNHSCSVKSNGTLWCWGDNNHGQLGDGSINKKAIPVKVNDDTDWALVSPGQTHTCAIKTDGTLYCWGEGKFLGVGNITTDKPTPQQESTLDNTWTTVSVNAIHTCATKKDLSIWCWGDGTSGKLGSNSGSNLYEPTKIISDLGWDSVDTGVRITCGIALIPNVNLSDSRIMHCWGASTDLRHGLPSSGIPVEIEPEMEWKSVDAGWGYVCAISIAGQLYCFGNGSDGKLANGSSFGSSDVFVLSTDQSTGWETLSSNMNHACAVKDNNALYCWGDNRYGQIGYGVDFVHQDALSPEKIGQNDWDQVSVGQNHTCAIKTDNTLWCWGRNAWGALGNGSAWSGEPRNISLQ